MTHINIFVILLGIVSHTLSACDFSANLCDFSSTLCPTASLALLSNGTNTFSSRNFDVLSFGDTTLSNADVQGTVATRNDLVVQPGNSTVGDGDNDINGINSVNSYVLLVGHNLVLNGALRLENRNSNINANGSPNSFVGDQITNQTTDVSSLGSIETCANRGLNNACLDSSFDSSRSYWTQLSNQLAAESNNVDVSYNNNQAAVNCHNSGTAGTNTNDNRFYFVTLNPNNLSNGIVFSNCSTTTSFVINWIGLDNITFVGTQNVLDNSGNGDRGYIIYNFPNASSVYVNSTSFYGTILAPSSNVYIEGSTITGQIVAGDLTVTNGRVNQFSNCPTTTTSIINQESSDDITFTVNVMMTVAIVVLAIIL